MAIQLQRRLASLLTTEVDQLREDKKLLGERLEAQAETLSRVSTAATGMLNALTKATVYAPNIKAAAANLEAALTPKG